MTKPYQRSPDLVKDVLTDPRGDFKLSSTFVTLDHVTKLRTDYATLLDGFNQLKVMVHQHDSHITYKLVDHHLLKETIKNYLHDFEIQLRNSTSNELNLFKEVMQEKIVKIDSFQEHQVRYVGEREYLRDMAKLKDQIEYIE